jgi:hypothetical protein
MHAKLRQIAMLKREARKAAKRLRGLPKNDARRRAAAVELRDWRTKYEKARYNITGTKRNRVQGF